MKNNLLRLICCNSTHPHKQYDKIYQCHNCKNLWHESCYPDRGSCCNSSGANTRFANETEMYTYNARRSAVERA